MKWYWLESMTLETLMLLMMEMLMLLMMFLTMMTIEMKTMIQCLNSMLNLTAVMLKYSKTTAVLNAASTWVEKMMMMMSKIRQRGWNQATRSLKSSTSPNAFRSPWNRIEYADRHRSRQVCTAVQCHDSVSVYWEIEFEGQKKRW